MKMEFELLLLHIVLTLAKLCKPGGVSRLSLWLVALYTATITVAQVELDYILTGDLSGDRACKGLLQAYNKVGLHDFLKWLMGYNKTMKQVPRPPSAFRHSRQYTFA